MTTIKHDDLEMPAFLKRETNAKGVSLSAGVVTPTKVPAGMTSKKAAKIAAKIKAKASKPEPKPVKVEAKKTAKKTAKTEPKLPKATPTTAAPALNADGTPIEKVSRSIVPMKFKAKYAATAGTCGDSMALELKAATTTLNADKRETLDVEALWAIAKANEIDVSKYVDLNNGQKRMNVGNKLRGRLNQGHDVVIGKQRFKAEDWQPRR